MDYVFMSLVHKNEIIYVLYITVIQLLDNVRSYPGLL